LFWIITASSSDGAEFLEPSLFCFKDYHLKGESSMAGKVFVIKSESLGRGDNELGTMLMANFLRILGEAKEMPSKLVFWNCGVRLVCEGSHVLPHLKHLEKKGVTILACGTCLDFFNLTDKQKVDKPTTRLDSVQSMLDSTIVSL